ncbi:hypothetical protein OAI94_00345 [bacterium]|nr:hypothetical protein [bacterium]
MIKLIKAQIYKLIYSNEDLIVIDSDLIDQISKKSIINFTEVKKLKQLKNKNFKNEIHLHKELNILFDNLMAKKILDYILDVRKNINGRPSNLNYPLY